MYMYHFTYCTKKVIKCSSSRSTTVSASLSLSYYKYQVLQVLVEQSESFTVVYVVFSVRRGWVAPYLLLDCNNTAAAHSVPQVLEVVLGTCNTRGEREATHSTVV